MSLFHSNKHTFPDGHAVYPPHSPNMLRITKLNQFTSPFSRQKHTSSPLSAMAPSRHQLLVSLLLFTTILASAQASFLIRLQLPNGTYLRLPADEATPSSLLSAAHEAMSSNSDMEDCDVVGAGGEVVTAACIERMRRKWKPGEILVVRVKSSGEPKKVEKEVRQACKSSVVSREEGGIDGI